MTWDHGKSAGQEVEAIKHLIVPYTRGIGVEVSDFPRQTWPHFKPVFVEHQLEVYAEGALDFVFSSFFLNTVENPAREIKNWWAKIKDGGYLVLHLPHQNHYPRVGSDAAYPNHKHDFKPEDITSLMEEHFGWDLEVNQIRTEGDEYGFIQVYKKTSAVEHTFSYQDAGEEPKCLVIRYGGIGDMIQASSIFPGLKEQGYRVIVNTTPRGEHLLKHDPNVDGFLIQDTDQVPNDERLQEYWAALGKEYDKVVNLSESVEGTLLALPGRRTYHMPKQARHKILNINYLEFQHELAEVPFVREPRFYPTPAEQKEAKAWRDEIAGNEKVIVWSLAGSSVHKAWPWSDIAAAWILEHSDAKIVFVGDARSSLLEAAILQGMAHRFMHIPPEESDGMTPTKLVNKLKKHFNGKRRIFLKSGKWDIRETLAFLEVADCVVGPETGVLNSASMLKTPKVVLLSHSSQKNLTEGWLNTQAIEPKSVACYPCHRMHYSREFCPEDPGTGASICAAAIEPKTVFEAIMVGMGTAR